VLTQMTRQWFPLAIRTSVQGTVAALGRIGAACSPVIVATLLMGILGLTWQAALLVLALLGVALAAAFWLLVPDRPPQAEPVRQPGQPAVLHLNRGSLLSLGMLLLYA